jgi:hypothetical protein
VALRPVPGPFVGWRHPPGATRRAPSRQQRFEPPLLASRPAVSEHRVTAVVRSRTPPLPEAVRRRCPNPAPLPPGRAPPPPVRVFAPSSSPRRPSPRNRARSFRHRSLLLRLPVCRSPPSTPASSAMSLFFAPVRPLPCPLRLCRRATGAVTPSRTLAQEPCALPGRLEPNWARLWAARTMCKPAAPVLTAGPRRDSAH